MIDFCLIIYLVHRTVLVHALRLPFLLGIPGGNMADQALPHPPPGLRLPGPAAPSVHPGPLFSHLLPGAACHTSVQ